MQNLGKAGLLGWLFIVGTGVGTGAGASPFVPESLTPMGRIVSNYGGRDLRQVRGCQDFTGHWKGECKLSGVKTASEIFVSQYGCEAISVNGIVTTVGSNRTIVVDNIRYSGQDYGGYSSIDRVEWDAAKQVLKGSYNIVASASAASTGFLQPTFLKSETKRYDKTLSVEMVTGQFTYSCEYALQ